MHLHFVYIFTLVYVKLADNAPAFINNSREFINHKAFHISIKF